MNKLFSTLCAGAVLATVGTTSASAIKLKADGAYNEKLYQVTVGTTGDSVLYMTKRADGNDSLYVKSLKALPANEFANTLWCVAVSKPAVQGQSYTFDFLNKSTGKKLAVDMKSLILGTGVTVTADHGLPVGTEIDGWAFSMKAGDNEIETGMPLYSYIPGKDSLAVLAYKNLNASSADVSALTKDHMVALTVEANDAAKAKMIADGYTFTIAVPKRLPLNAKALHTILGSRDSALINLGFYKKIGNKEQKLDHKKIQNNVFAQGLVAVDDATTGGVFLMKADKSAYLRIDTAYQNTSGEDFLTFTDTTKVATFNADKAAQKTGIYTFFFNYAPEGDSLFIKMDTAIYSANIGKGPFDVYRAGGDSTHVVLQDLEANQAWALTVGKDTIRTRIGLGFGTCSASASNKVSLANGLYTIKDKATGKYFAFPLHHNGTRREWIDFDEDSQLAAHMPAYQWIIRKTQTASVLAETSSIIIENREYPTEAGGAMTVQLYKDKDGKIYVATGELAGAELEIVAIDKETYPEAYNDPYLGYKHLDPAVIEYNVNKYKFKYFHPYATGENARYLSVGGEKDTLLYAKEYKAGASAFELKSSGKERNYGVTVVKDNPYHKIGIAQLKRTAYVIAQGTAVMDSIVNQKYAMANGVAVAELDSFYFKENNHYNGDDFYAILKAVEETAGKVEPKYSKAGVSDNNMTSPVGVQSLTSEERTSAFAISLDDTPLYRRFNNANIDEVETGVDSLIFYERYRNEYLMDETNENFLNETVDYLGIWSKDKAKGKLAFVVDTAWVVRGAGNGIKPQYLISVNRDDFGGKDAEACPLDHNHGFDADGKPLDKWSCSHANPAVPAFQRGKYLVSFADSVVKYGRTAEEALPYLDDDHAYTRVGFVEAIKKGDSLYILPNAYKSLKNEEINFELLVKENDELVKQHSVSPCPFIINLKNDHHKNVTWSFRYVYPEKALDVTEEGKDNSFLIESMAYTEKDGKYETVANGGEKHAIAPNVAAWLKNQNGCLVLTNEKSTFANAITGGDPALRFNIDRKGADDNYATDNEEIATSEVAVIAGEGQVTIANAAGKKVVITNILGQVVANTVITSSNAAIAAPQGVVVVAVEGEEAVKAIVK